MVDTQDITQAVKHEVIDAIKAAAQGMAVAGTE